MLPEEREHIEEEMDIWGAIFKKDIDSGKLERSGEELKLRLFWTAKNVLRVKRVITNYDKAVRTGIEEMDEVKISDEDTLEIEDIVTRKLKDLKI